MPKKKAKKQNKPRKPYEIVRKNGLEYVIVYCPRGHKNEAQKVSDLKISAELVCANVTCKMQWTETLPRIQGLEEAE